MKIGLLFKGPPTRREKRFLTQVGAGFVPIAAVCKHAAKHYK